ncbi:hypothetical protein [Actinoplanes sp. NPDC051494]|uniref:hypothetical protein n=1 Tax=Actinoplanes sp. NPDC051494 TaxID=3363907 RepID=UPI0037A1B61D
MVLIALAFAMPALSSPPEAPEPAIVVTTVDAPMSPGLSGRIVVPDRPAADGLATSLLETPAGSPAAGTPLVIGSAPLPLSGSAHHGDRAERAPPQI